MTRITYTPPDLPTRSELRDRISSLALASLRDRLEREESHTMLALSEAQGAFSLLSVDYFAPSVGIYRTTRHVTAERLEAMRYWMGLNR